VGGEAIAGLLVLARGGVSGLRAADRGPLANVLSIRLNGVGVVINLAIERRVDARYVVALEIVVDVGLPVAVHFVGAALGKLHVREIELAGMGGQATQARAKRGSLGIEIDEDKVEPLLEANGDEAELFRIEILHAL